MVVLVLHLDPRTMLQRKHCLACKVICLENFDNANPNRRQSLYRNDVHENCDTRHSHKLSELHFDLGR